MRSRRAAFIPTDSALPLVMPAFSPLMAPTVSRGMPHYSRGAFCDGLRAVSPWTISQGLPDSTLKQAGFEPSVPFAAAAIKNIR